MDSAHRDPAHSLGDNQLDGTALSGSNHEHKPSMESGITGSNGDTVASNGNSEAADGHAPAQQRPDPYVEQVKNVVTSDIGIQILLTRLKQSVASAKEFAAFLQKRSRLEEDHASGLRKISRTTHDNLRRPEHRQGSFISSYDEVTKIHERMADNGSQFASSLHQMHEDLVELAANIERGRKQWKGTGLAAEQRLVDAEAAMRKSKAKYDSLAEDYDRARTGDRQATKKFGLKGPKSAAQHEEELMRKVQAADADYQSKVQAAQTTRQELLNRARPETVKNLQDMIKECDSALTLQMQKFASFSEKLLLSNGMSVSPLKGEGAAKNGRSLREAIADINNEGDLNYYVASHSSQVLPKPEPRYEQHPTLRPAGSSQPQLSPVRQSEPAQGMSSFSSRQGPPGGPTGTPPSGSPMGHGSSFSTSGAPPPLSQHPTFQAHERSTSNFGQNQNGSPGQFATGSQGQDPMRSQGNVNQHSPMHQHQPSQSMSQSSYRSEGPPQLGSLPFQTTPSTSFSGAPAPAPVPAPGMHQSPPPTQGAPPQQAVDRGMHQPTQSQSSYGAPQGHLQHQPYGSIGSMGSRNDTPSLPPLRPVFGLTLEALFDRDGSAVPMVVYQCIQAVDLFGLEVEGIYRLSGTGSHVSKIRAMFDNDASKLDFRDPAAFFHDVNSVAGLLKQFFRDLPDPLLTSEHYSAFIEAAKAEDDTVRRDSLHAIINALPDPNYATLRAITLHLHRVVENASVNRMNSSNLAIVWGPTLMGAGGGGRIQDAGWQVKVVQTILDSCYQIFDDD